MDEFKKWIERCGGIGKAAELISEYETQQGNQGVTYQSLQDWMRTGSVPPRRVLAVEAVSGIPCTVLDPATYPVERFGKRPRRAPTAA